MPQSLWPQAPAWMGQAGPYIAMFGPTIAAFVSVVIATFVLIFTVKKFALDRETQRFTSAVHLYRQYLVLGFEHPDFAEPEESKTGPPDFQKYQWFVGVCLRACDELLEHSSPGSQRSVQFRNAITEHLTYHHAYLASDKWFIANRALLYSPALLMLIDEVIARRAAIARGV